MKILLNQKFGLGNQLFQYAAGLYFAEKYGATLEVIPEVEEAAVSFGHPRPFLLSNFCISARIRKRTLFDRVLRSQSPSVAAAAAPVRRLGGTYSHDPHFSNVGSFQPSLQLPRGTRRIYLNGFFQVYQYAEAMERQLRNEFAFREPASGKNLELLERIRNCKCPVSLHLRRGDYVIGWNGINLLPMNYYEDAIAAIRKLHADPTFFIFSDDIASAREMLRTLEPAVFVDNNDDHTAHEDLRLMSSCSHHILANSTFSWWGAWLNPNPEKTVLVPDPWHSDPHPDLIPATWRLIQTLAVRQAKPVRI